MVPNQGRDAETGTVLELATALTNNERSSTFTRQPCAFKWSFFRSDPFHHDPAPGIFSLGHLLTCILLEQSCVGDQRELSLDA